jgi:hypothetical protein
MLISVYRIANYSDVAFFRYENPSFLVIINFVVLYSSFSFLSYANTVLRIRVYAVIPHDWIALLTDPYTRQRVLMYLVFLEGSLALRIGEDAVMTAAVNAIASHPGICAVVDRDAGKTLAGDLAVLEYQCP